MIETDLPGDESPTLTDGILAAVDPARARDGIQRVLHAIRCHLGMNVGFLTEFIGPNRVFRYVDTDTVSLPLKIGQSLSLEQGYCLKVVQGRLPTLIVDTHDEPAALAIPETGTIPIGSHLSVPIRLRDGTVYGTFCCFSFEPRPSLNERDLAFFSTIADLVASQIDDQIATTRSLRAKADAIQAVIAEGGLDTVFQPIHRLEDRSIAAFECLTRFPKAPFKPVVEWFQDAVAVGCGLELEFAALESSVARLKAWPAPITASLNMSPRALLARDLAPILDGIDLGRIVVEITEHEQVFDYPRLNQVLDGLRARGLRVAIDDAGAGYSSLRHILLLRPDIIKLDLSLVRDIDRDADRQALADALTLYCRRSGIAIVAEGIETEAEFATLRRMGIELGQGYLLSRPGPLATWSDAAGHQKARSF